MIEPDKPELSSSSSEDDEMPLDGDPQQIFAAETAPEQPPQVSDAFALKSKDNQIKILLSALSRERAKSSELTIRQDVLLAQFRQKVSLV